MRSPKRTLIAPALLTRRRFIEASAASLVTTGCAGRWQTSEVAAPDGAVTMRLSDYPALSGPGTMVAISPGGGKPVLVLRLEGDEFRALSLECTHLGCTVRWDQEQDTLRCPCHGSRFDRDGQVTKGPAKKPLPGYPVTFDGEAIQFTVT